MQTAQLSWATSFGLYAPLTQGEAKVVLGKSSFNRDDDNKENRRAMKDDYAAISSMFDDGLNMQQIAEKTGINYRYVRRILIRCGKISDIVLNKKSRKVVQLSMSGEYIKTYDSVVNAASLLGIDFDGIFKCCKKRNKTTQGYRFMWAYEYFGTPDEIAEEEKMVAPIKKIEPLKIRQTKISVEYVNAAGRVIATFKSMKQAEKGTPHAFYWIRKSLDTGYKFEDGSYFKVKG